MALKIHPVTKVETDYEGYNVKINGISVPLNTARVSAVPFNRRWPGHQRGREQTELINFLTFESDEPVVFEITPNKSFEEVVIRPQSLGIKPEIKGNAIVFTLEKPAYFTIEPFGRNNALHVFGDSICEYDIDKTDENVLYFGKGEHDVGMLNLKSYQTLFIEEGAVVY